MTMRKARIVLLLGMVAFSFIALASGASYLEMLLPGGIPLGNAIAAFGLCGLPGLALLLSPHDTLVRKASLIALLAAAAWLPVSIALAGNLELSFGGGRGTAWVAITLGSILASVTCLVWALIALCFGRPRAGAA
jgi:hypothetical protein